MNYILMGYCSNEATSDILLVSRSKDRIESTLNKIIKHYKKEHNIKFIKNDFLKNEETIVYYANIDNGDGWYEFWIEAHKTGKLSKASNGYTSKKL